MQLEYDHDSTNKTFCFILFLALVQLFYNFIFSDWKEYHKSYALL